ncbi:MAG TPA: InlB B-repeat-containing protein [Oscillospiraceae bacterium]|nr:InlB B-repeat-containing protein [Oscillospiraceae bacterium]
MIAKITGIFKERSRKALSLLVVFAMLLSILPTISLKASASGWTGYTAINNQSDLASISSNLSGKYYLSQDITVTGSWSGIGSDSTPFTGIFDGNGKKITFSSSTVSGTGAHTGGLFNYVSGTYSGSASSAASWTSGIVKNVTVTGVVVTSNYEYTGSVIGFLLNAYVGGVTVQNGTVTTTANFASGIIGGSDGTDLVEKCYNGTYHTASGENDGVIVHCTGNHSCSGGIVGMAFGDSYVKECYNYGNVNGTACDGGIVGHLEGSATVRNCINYGTIKDAWRSGGIVGAACLAEMSLGGGSKGYETIENCANFGSIQGSCANPAGISAFGGAYNVHVSNCYTVNLGRIYLSDTTGENFIALYSSGSKQVTDAFMKSAATTGYDATTTSFTSLVDQLNSDVMNCNVNKTIFSNITADQIEAGTNEWFFWKIDTNASSLSYGYPVFSDSFVPTSRGGSTTNTVTLNVNGGVINSGNVTSYISGTQVTLPTNVTKDHYTFAGWYVNADFSGDAVTKISSADTGAKIYYAKWTKNTNYEVKGKVVNDVMPVPSSVNAAIVKLVKGQTQIGSVTTADDGTFTILNVPTGAYNLIISKGDTTATVLVEVSGADKNAGTITLPAGKQNSIIEVKDKTPSIIVGNLDAQFADSATDNSKGFTSTDKAIVAAGGKAEIKFTAQKMDEATALNANNIKISAQSDGKTIGSFLDFSVFKTVTPSAGTPTTTRLTELPKLIEILIPLDSSLQGKSGYAIYRYHGAAVDTITETPNADGEYLSVNAEKTQVTLYIKKFSTYAIAYGTASKNNVSSISTSQTPVKNQDTGDHTPVHSLVLLGMSALTTMVYMNRRRKHRVSTKR